MSGIYGIKRGADVAIDDIEVLMHYTSSRSSEGDGEFVKLNASEVLKTNKNPNSDGNEVLGGMYTLKLPTQLFGTKGYYTIMIRPKEIRTKISDVGVLSAQSNIRGLVFDTSEIESQDLSKFNNNGLIGYRIEYLDPTANNAKLNNLFRIVTSNNKAEPVNQNLTNTNQKAIRYRFNDNANLVFATVTPNSSGSAKPNVTPFIGEPNQPVILTHTHFNPTVIEVEMVEHDIETLAYALYGPQSKSLEDGVYTIYNFDNEIYKQYNLFEIKESFDGKPLYEIREPRISIDFDKGFDNITEV
jgi:hypothetical protein